MAKANDFIQAEALLLEVLKMLNAMINKMKQLENNS